MKFKLKTPELIELDKRIVALNKRYAMGLYSLNQLPNIHAVKEFVKEASIIQKDLKKIKTNDEFEKLFIENAFYNIDAQIVYLKYFTNGIKGGIKELFKKVLGEDSLDIIINGAKNFDYKGFWDYYLSYQEYTYKRIPSDDESLRVKLQEILVELKKDILDYGTKHFSLPENYDFDAVLGQPYSQETYFHPTNRRMEISPSKFFVFKENNEIKINVCVVIECLFHEILGHGLQEANSRDMPLSVQCNSINCPLHSVKTQIEGIALLAERESINFMKMHKEKYKIEDDYIKQIELFLVQNSSENLLIFFNYLKFRKLEDDSIDLEKEFKKIVNNHGLYLIYSTINHSPFSCIGNSAYPLGLHLLNSLNEKFKKELKKDFEKNTSLINQALSKGLWNTKTLEKFVRFFLRSNGLKV